LIGSEDLEIYNEKELTSVSFNENGIWRIDAKSYIWRKPICMKSREKFRKKLHKLIDNIDDEALLNTLNEEIVPNIINSM